MKFRACLPVVAVFHHPYIVPLKEGPFSEEEQDFFETLSETCLPFLELFDTLEADGVPFRPGIVLSPTLCALFRNDRLLERYLLWLDERIEFGSRELKRCAADGELLVLAEYYLERDRRRRALLTDRYGCGLLAAFQGLCRRGRLELLASAATQAFLPFYTSVGEAVRAQIETALVHHRQYLGKTPEGFWLPDLGWTAELGSYLREYRFTYTITTTHALVLGSPQAERGSFYPVQTPSDIIVFGRDDTIQKDVETLAGQGRNTYRSCRDAGFELSTKTLGSLLGPKQCRFSTGYRYWAGDGKGKKERYNPRMAQQSAAAAASSFLRRRLSRLEEARQYMEAPVNLWAFDADALGRSWYEGISFLEALARNNVRRSGSEETIRLCSPLDYLETISPSSLQQTEPAYSSALRNGYSEPLLDASNDWSYRHIFRSIHRMAEMTERFSGDTGLRERALNQAARELLLSQSADWFKALNPQYRSRINRDYAEQELEGALRNFTTIYEALGSSHISTEWLTVLERKHDLLPRINYRVFGKKK